MCYAKRYANCQPVDILQLQPQKRLLVMKALTAMAKYQGRYDEWLQTRRHYNLKWSTPDAAMASFEQFFNPDMTLESMIQKVKRMIEVLPSQLAEVVRFAALTGLRPTEAVESAKLIAFRDTLKLYYNQEHQTLEHFRFPEIFLRQTKKAYVSFLTLDNYQRVVSLGAKTLAGTR